MSEFVALWKQKPKNNAHALEVSESFQNVEGVHCAQGEDARVDNFVSIGSCSWVLV